MKKIAILSTIILLVMSMAYAQEEMNVSAGTTPDNLFWGVDVAFDKISLAMTFDKSKKLDKGLEIAQERLEEIKSMVQQNKLKQSEKAKKEHQKLLDDIDSGLDDVSSGDNLEEFEQELKIEKKLEKHREDIEEFEAKIVIKGNLTQEQQDALDAFMASLGDNVRKVEVKIKNRQEQTKLKILKDMPGSDDKIEELEADKWQRKALHEEEKAQEEIIKAEKKLAGFEEKKSRLGSGNKSEDRSGKINKTKNNSTDDDDESGSGNLITGQVSGSGKDEDSDPIEKVSASDSGENDEDSSDSENDLNDEDSQNEAENSDSQDDDSDLEVENETETEDELQNETEDAGSEDETEVEIEGSETEFEDENKTEKENELDSLEDSILREFNLTVPVYEERSVNSSLRYIGDAKDALARSKELYAGGEYKASYAYARLAKKLAGRALSGKYLSVSDPEKDVLKQNREDERKIQDKDDDVAERENKSREGNKGKSDRVPKEPEVKIEDEAGSN